MSDLIEDVRLAHRLPPPAMARAIRESAHVTQQALAEHLGVHRITLVRWEAGTRIPQGKLRVKYARVLDELQKAIAA